MKYSYGFYDSGKGTRLTLFSCLREKLTSQTYKTALFRLFDPKIFHLSNLFDGKLGGTDCKKPNWYYYLHYFNRSRAVNSSSNILITVIGKFYLLNIYLFNWL